MRERYTHGHVRLPPSSVSLLFAAGFGKWQDDHKVKCVITWKKFEDWASAIYKWVRCVCVSAPRQHLINSFFPGEGRGPRRRRSYLHSVRDL